MDNKEKTNEIKPDCPIIGADGNIFNLIGIASKTLKRNGLKDQATEMSNRVTSSKSYNEALSVICEYVNPVDAEIENKQNYGMNM